MEKFSLTHGAGRTDALKAQEAAIARRNPNGCVYEHLQGWCSHLRQSSGWSVKGTASLPRTAPLVEAPLWSISFSAPITKAAELSSPCEGALTGVPAQVHTAAQWQVQRRNTPHHPCALLLAATSPLTTSQTAEAVQVPRLKFSVLSLLLQHLKRTQPRTKDLFCWILRISCA